MSKNDKVNYYKQCYETMELAIEQQQILFNKQSELVDKAKEDRDYCLEVLKKMKGSLIVFQRLIDKGEENG